MNAIWFCCPSHRIERRAVSIRKIKRLRGKKAAFVLHIFTAATNTQTEDEESVYNLVTHADQTLLITITNINMSSFSPQA